MSENTTTSYEEGDFPLDAPDAKVSVKEVFGIDMEIEQIQILAALAQK